MTDNASPPKPLDGTLTQRLLRLWPYFRSAKAGIALAAAATLVGALTEPLIPALLKTLLDRGFAQGNVELWMVPVALMGLFGIRGIAGFTAQYALSYTASLGLLNLRRAMFAKLNDASEFASIKPSNTQASAFGVTASSSAQAGSYGIEVLQTAQAQRTASGSFADRSTPLNGGSAFTLNLTLGGVSQDPIAVTTATPAGMVSAINGAKLGVTAQLINTGSGFNVVLTGETGAIQSFTMGSDDGSGNAVADLGFTNHLQTAADANFKVNGLTVTRSTNSISDVIDGVTLDLYTNTTGAARLDLNRETTGIKDNLKGLVTAYNDFEATLKILGDAGSEVEEFGGALAGESLLQTVRTQVRDFIISNSSAPGTNIKAARDVGISFDRNGKLTLDETKLDKALQNHFGEVSTMFTAGANSRMAPKIAASGTSSIVRLRACSHSTSNPAISKAAPAVKPNSAVGEMKLASAPRRSAPMSHCISPTSRVTASASCT